MVYTEKASSHHTRKINIVGCVRANQGKEGAKGHWENGNLTAHGRQRLGLGQTQIQGQG